MKRVLMFFSLAAALAGCGHLEGYIGFWERQHRLANAFAEEPAAAALRDLKLDECCLLMGRISIPESFKGPVLVLATTDTFKKREVVARRLVPGPAEYYQAYLPEGRYDLHFFADLDGNGFFGASERIGGTEGSPILVSKAGVRDGLTVRGPVMVLDPRSPSACDFPVNDPVRESSYVRPSLDDEIFDPKYGTMGFFDPKSMLERTQRLMFALEPFDPGKTLVVFIHGVDGTPRHFKYIVEGLDKTRYQPWFYYYPSGMPLQKLGAYLADTIEAASKSRNFKSTKIIVVAHSMGGLVALAALNELSRNGVPPYLKGYISICSPYGGVNEAVSGLKRAPVVIPSWRDVVPGSPFLERLYGGRALGHMPFYLIFGYQEGQSSDGTIALHSQLEPKVHFSASQSFGFSASHVGVLNDEGVRQTVYRLIAVLEN